MIFDILIIGSGPAGLSAGIYAGRAGRKTLLLTGPVFGGQMSTIPDLENYPGIDGSISGFDLTEIMRKQVENFGVEIKFDSIKSLEKDGENYLTELQSGEKIQSKVVIIATGSDARKLGVKGEDEFFGKGVSYCAVCDGFFNRGKKVAFIGGGNSALVEALYMSKLASEVTIIYRKDSFFRGEKITIDKITNTPNIKVLFNSVVEEIKGDDSGVKSVIIKNLESEEISELNLDSVFVSIGHHPNAEFAPDFLERDQAGYLITEKNKTKVVGEGIFIAGDIRSSSKHQVAIAVGTGASAAMEAEDYLQTK